MLHILLSIIFLSYNVFGLNSKNFNQRIDQLLKQSWECYEQGNYKCMIENSKETLKLSKKYNNEKGIAESYYYLGIAYFSINDMNNALKYTRLAVEYAEKKKNYRWIVYSYTLLGEIFRNLGKSDYALKYFKKSLEFAKKNNNAKMIPIILINIANIYFENKNYKKALNTYQNALELAKKEKLRKSYQALILFNIGLSYYKIGDFKKAIMHLKKSAYLFKEIGNMRNYLESVYFTAKSYLALGNKDKAEIIIKENLPLAKNHGLYLSFYKLLKTKEY